MLAQRESGITERVTGGIPGFPMLFLSIALTIVGIVGIVVGAINLDSGGGVEYAAMVIGGIALIIVSTLGYGGLTVVNPNEARALVLFGSYHGSLKRQGFWWVNPFTIRRRISVRIRNFESAKLKVNDHDGNPIEIATVVVWRVRDTAEALFQVDDYEQFVRVQTEAALRNVATSYPYDGHQPEEISLRGHPQEIGEKVQAEIQGRLEKAGIEVMDTRISHLAYAPEIANAMLRRQQASAVIDARTRIVDGAVSMVEMALDQLSQRHVVELDEERKASMVSNLLVVLCSEHETQPVVNAGTLYQ